jgi:hypothetical protein
VKVGTPLGTYPLRFRRLERREGGVAIVGLVAGMESSLVLERSDLVAVLVVAVPLAGLGFFRARRRAT